MTRREFAANLRRIAAEIETGAALAEGAHPPPAPADLARKAIAGARDDARTIRRAANLLEAE